LDNIMPTLASQWQNIFWQTAQQHSYANMLRDASIQGRLGDWTRTLTAVTVATCRELGWQASAKDHHLDLLPVPHFEYLTMDVMAFPEGKARWHFPIAVLELENSKDSDRIGYSLWKVLCVRAKLRVVFCYRQSADEGAQLVRFLRDEVIHAMQPDVRQRIEGDTVVVVGSRDDGATFPYGFFRWWYLEPEIGSFRRS
jgi:hypothetical protein